MKEVQVQGIAQQQTVKIAHLSISSMNPRCVIDQSVEMYISRFSFPFSGRVENGDYTKSSNWNSFPIKRRLGMLTVN